jgi:hypothetical protein
VPGKESRQEAVAEMCSTPYRQVWAASACTVRVPDSPIGLSTPSVSGTRQPTARRSPPN